jgi:hypothetical protein
MAVRIGGQAQYHPATFPALAQIQALLNGGERDIVFGAGEYVLSGSLVIPADVRIRGDGRNSTVFSYNSAAPLTTLIEMGARSSISGVRIRRTGAGGVINAISSTGAGIEIRDSHIDSLAVNIAHDDCRVSECLIDNSDNGIVISGNRCQVFRNVISGCVRGIHLLGNFGLVEGNTILGSAPSTRGIHIAGTADFSRILHNHVRNILTSSPGRGVDLDSPGESNFVGHNVFSGTFGAKAFRASGAVPGSVQVIGTVTAGVSPSGARFEFSDLGGATGFANI